MEVEWKLKHKLLLCNTLPKTMEVEWKLKHKLLLCNTLPKTMEVEWKLKHKYFYIQLKATEKYWIVLIFIYTRPI